MSMTAASIGREHTYEAPRAAGRERREPADALAFEPADLHENGALGLLVEAEDPAVRESLKREILRRDAGAVVKADLPIIGGFAVEVAPETLADVEELSRRTPGAKILVDERVTVPEPEEEYLVAEGREAATVTMGVDAMMSGTSMASPFVAGCVALFAEVKPDITTKEAQELLYRTGRKLPCVEPVVQGKGGVINPLRAVEALAQGSPARTGA